MHLAQENFLLRESSKPKKRIRRSKNVELTDRDLEILRFILEMKFSSVEHVFLKFFKKTRSHMEARSTAWAKKRLQQLEHGGFLKATFSMAERTRYYAGTFRGYYALKQMNASDHPVKPTAIFDQRTFLHDRCVLEARLHLESKGEATSWISDRQLRAYPDLTWGLTGNNVPDAIYSSSNGEKIALELELAQKEKGKYREKVKRYLSILRDSRADKPFTKVRFLVSKESVRRILEDETRLFPEFFSIQQINVSQK